MGHSGPRGTQSASGELPTVFAPLPAPALLEQEQNGSQLGSAHRVRSVRIVATADTKQALPMVFT